MRDTQLHKVLICFLNLNYAIDIHLMKTPSQQNILNSYCIKLLNHQQVLQKDTTKMCLNCQTYRYGIKNDNFLADLQTYDREGEQSFSDWLFVK